MIHSNSYLNSVAALEVGRRRTEMSIIRNAFNAIELMGISNFTMDTPIHTISGYSKSALVAKLNNNTTYNLATTQIPDTVTARDIVNILKQCQIELEVDNALVLAYEVVITIKEVVGDESETTKDVDDTQTVADLIGEAEFTALDIEEALELTYDVQFDVDEIADTTTVAEIVDMINARKTA